LANEESVTKYYCCGYGYLGPAQKQNVSFIFQLLSRSLVLKNTCETGMLDTKWKSPPPGKKKKKKEKERTNERNTVQLGNQSISQDNAPP
jgi:hypothetical protein